MRRFEYEITRHAAETLNELTFFCSEKGRCTLDKVPRRQTEVLKGILNEQGWAGWELVQIAFGDNGLVAFWKRPLPEK